MSPYVEGNKNAVVAPSPDDSRTIASPAAPVPSGVAHARTRGKRRTGEYARRNMGIVPNAMKPIGVERHSEDSVESARNAGLARRQLPQASLPAPRNTAQSGCCALVWALSSALVRSIGK